METITWKTYEHIHTDKSSDWYWIVGVVTVTIAIIAILLNNIIFAVLILIGSFTLTLLASKKPNLVNVTISSTGIMFNKTLFAYSGIESFWVETRDSYPRLLLKPKKLFAPFIVILLEDADPDDVRDILEKKLPAEEHAEPLLEKLLIYFGF